MPFDACRAAAWAHYRYFHEWQELAPEDQAYLIAVYQLDHEITALMQHEAAEAVRKAGKKKPNGR